MGLSVPPAPPSSPASLLLSLLLSRTLWTQAVNRLCGLYGAGQGNSEMVKLMDYTVSSVTAGIDALGEVTVRLQVCVCNLNPKPYTLCPLR